MKSLTAYQKKLFVFLSVATFFEGYDFLALTQILPNLRADMNLPPEYSGYLVAFVNIGAILSYIIVRKADRWGRKRVLTITIGGYTLFTVLSGLAPNVWVFAIAQLIARVFLLGEWAISMVMAAEEFPAAQRGMVIGVIQGCSSLGSVVCAGVVPLLLTTDYGWRSVYFVGAIPLVLLAIGRRGLKETKRFEEQASETKTEFPLTRIWKTPYRKRMLMMGLIWFVAYIAAQNAVTFWKEFAIAERGFTDAQVGKAITFAALGSMPFVFAAGKLLDIVGRKIGAAIVFVIASLGVYGSYTLSGVTELTIALGLGIFGASAYLPLLNSYTAELFPTELRGDAFAWSNNLLGRLSYVLAPMLMGYLAGQEGSYEIVAYTAVFPILAIVLIWVLLPETKNKELEETSALDPGVSGF